MENIKWYFVNLLVMQCSYRTQAKKYCYLTSHNKTGKEILLCKRQLLQAFFILFAVKGQFKVTWAKLIIILLG